MRPGPAIAAAALVAVAGCGRADRAPGTRSSDAAAATAPPADAAAVTTGPIPVDATQLVVGVAGGWDAPRATLTRYQRAGGPWQQVGEPVAASLGSAGSAWGRGLHGAGAPAGRAGPVKREGDGRSPAGVFRVLRAYGYAGAPVAGAALPYDRLDAAWRCVDDPASAHYNRVLDTTGVAVDWASAEIMRRDDELYRWVIELDHNRAGADAVPGDGSCIFMHVRDRADDVTAGCTSMAPADLETLLAWLRPGAAYVLLPAAERAALAAAWRLPES